MRRIRLYVPICTFSQENVTLHFRTFQMIWRELFGVSRQFAETKEAPKCVGACVSSRQTNKPPRKWGFFVLMF